MLIILTLPLLWRRPFEAFWFGTRRHSTTPMSKRESQRRAEPSRCRSPSIRYPKNGSLVRFDICMIKGQKSKEDTFPSILAKALLYPKAILQHKWPLPLYSRNGTLN